MPTRKLDEHLEAQRWVAQRTCRDPDHEPPPLGMFEAGQYEHVCPSCGQISRFYVNRQQV